MSGGRGRGHGRRRRRGRADADHSGCDHAAAIAGLGVLVRVAQKSRAAVVVQRLIEPEERSGKRSRRLSMQRRNVRGPSW
jgi:hypothetical protein